MLNGKYRSNCVRPVGDPEQFYKSNTRSEGCLTMDFETREANTHLSSI